MRVLSVLFDFSCSSGRRLNDFIKILSIDTDMGGNEAHSALHHRANLGSFTGIQNVGTLLPSPQYSPWGLISMVDLAGIPDILNSSQHE
jgi:hypothetical protein